ncbi:MAG: methenyltetrahydromethanopterin cyclohydrolase [Beijerinckiaceae bacterium]|nr:methenyltetrahydromethanopterin cyclohydrolase [Beijerinckiaceae bacterium]
MSTSELSINTLAGQAVDRMIANAARLRVSVSKGAAGETIIDAGQNARGGIDAGLLIAEICLGGLGTVALSPTGANPKWPFELCVRSTDPVTACLASQYAGWALSHGEGKSKFFALGSGPGRALARKEPLFEELAYCDKASRATLVLESSQPPPKEIAEKVANECGVPRENVTFVYAPTQSLAGSVQVVALAVPALMAAVLLLRNRSSTCGCSHPARGTLLPSISVTI